MNDAIEFDRTSTDLDGRRYHFSEDPTIARFVPRPAPSDPGRPPGVRVVDAAHAPLYWWPRRCPRVYVWADDADQQAVLTRRFGTDASRVVAFESSWLQQVRDARIHCYEFDADAFVPDDAPGHHVSLGPVEVVRSGPLGDLLSLHARSDVELRITPRLGAVTDQVLRSGLPYRFMNLRVAAR